MENKTGNLNVILNIIYCYKTLVLPVSLIIRLPGISQKMTLFSVAYNFSKLYLFRQRFYMLDVYVESCDCDALFINSFIHFF